MPVGRSTDISTTTIKRRAIMLHPPPVRFSTPPAEGKKLPGPAMVMVAGLGNLTSCQLVKATTDQLMRTGGAGGGGGGWGRLVAVSLISGPAILDQRTTPAVLDSASRPLYPYTPPTTTTAATTTTTATALTITSYLV